MVCTKLKLEYLTAVRLDILNVNNIPCDVSAYMQCRSHQSSLYLTIPRKVVKFLRLNSKSLIEYQLTPMANHSVYPFLGRAAGHGPTITLTIPKVLVDGLDITKGDLFYIRLEKAIPLEEPEKKRKTRMKSKK